MRWICMKSRELEGKVTGFTASENVIGSEKESLNMHWGRQRQGTR